jgi:hypothetical protein
MRFNNVELFMSINVLKPFFTILVLLTSTVLTCNAQDNVSDTNGGLNPLENVFNVHNLTDDQSGVTVRLFETGGGDPAANGNRLVLAIDPDDPELESHVWQTGIDVYQVKDVRLNTATSELEIDCIEHYLDSASAFQERSATYVIRYSADSHTGTVAKNLKISRVTRELSAPVIDTEPDFSALEQQFADQLRDVPDALVPFLQDSYIVQGVASSCESLEAEECISERLYLSLYWKDRYGNTAEKGDDHKDRKSLIAELDPNSNPPLTLTRCWNLSGKLDRSHVGGLAYVKSTQGGAFLYTAGEYKDKKEGADGAMPEVVEAKMIERYPLSESAETPTGAIEYGSLAQCGVLRADEAWRVPDSAYLSHVVIEEIDYLLVGCFFRSGEKYKCDPPIDTPYIYGYKLDMTNGTLINASGESASTEQWDLLLKTRENVQGVDVYNGNLYLSTSFGGGSCRFVDCDNFLESDQSRIYQDDLNAARCTLISGAKKSVQCANAAIKSADSAHPRVLVKGGRIAGGEDLARVGNKLWSASESGSRHFHNRSGGKWSSYFPYVYDIMIPEAFGDAPAAKQGDPVNSRHAANVTTILTESYGGWYDNSDRIRVMDVNGDQRDDVVIGPYSKDGCWYVLEGSGGPANSQFIDRGCVINAYAGWYDNTDRFWIMDVNGDEHDDVVIGPYSKDGCWYVLQGVDGPDGSGFVNRGCQAKFKENWFEKTERIRPMDVNGDGADDIVIGPSSDGNWYILEGVVSALATFEAGRTLRGISPAYGGWYDNAERVNVLDANGDGRDDIVIGPYSEDGCWYLLEGKDSPADFVDRGCVEKAYAGWHDNADRFYIADFNGDGRDDIVIGPYKKNDEEKGCWYLLQGKGGRASLSDAGWCMLKTDYHDWWNETARIRVMQVMPEAPAAILIGPKHGYSEFPFPKKGMGEWQLLQGTRKNRLLNKQWAVNTMGEWADKAERIRIMDVNGDGRDDVVIGPSSYGNWYIMQGGALPASQTQVKQASLDARP